MSSVGETVRGASPISSGEVDDSGAFGKFKLFCEGLTARWLSVKGALSRGGGVIKDGVKPVAMLANRWRRVGGIDIGCGIVHGAQCCCCIQMHRPRTDSLSVDRFES